MPIWILRRDALATNPAPSHEPRTAAAIISTRVFKSTVTMAMKMKAWVIVASVCPTLSVPGIFSSATRRRSLSAAVVGA